MFFLFWQIWWPDLRFYLPFLFQIVPDLLQTCRHKGLRYWFTYCENVVDTSTTPVSVNPIAQIEAVSPSGIFSRMKLMIVNTRNNSVIVCWDILLISFHFFLWFHFLFCSSLLSYLSVFFLLISLERYRPCTFPLMSLL